VGGSQLHGAKVNATDDTVWYGVFIEPPEKMIGLDREEFFLQAVSNRRNGRGTPDPVQPGSQTNSRLPDTVDYAAIT
jgi:hypothetical protein